MNTIHEVCFWATRRRIFAAEKVVFQVWRGECENTGGLSSRAGATTMHLGVEINALWMILNFA